MRFLRAGAKGQESTLVPHVTSGVLESLSTGVPSLRVVTRGQPFPSQSLPGEAGLSRTVAGSELPATSVTLRGGATLGP